MEILGVLLPLFWLVPEGSCAVLNNNILCVINGEEDSNERFKKLIFCRFVKTNSQT